MKNLTKALIVLTFLAGLGVNAAEPVLINVPVDHVYAPKGFDSNDDVEVVVSGYLPNLCYKNPRATYTVEGNKIMINLKARRWNGGEKNALCAEAVVPFLESVHVGILDKGVYDIMVNKTAQGAIIINEATSDAVDENIYANVHYAQRVEGTRTVKLEGYNPSDCFEFDRVEFVNNGKDTYSVLPKMKQVSPFCPMKMVPFTYEMEVPTDLSADKVLLHVRAMDGKSVNALFYNNEF